MSLVDSTPQWFTHNTDGSTRRGPMVLLYSLPELNLGQTTNSRTGVVEKRIFLGFKTSNLEKILPN